MRAFRRAMSLWVVVLVCEACSRTRALGARPDTSGVWDVTYDDVMELEIRTSADVHRMRVSTLGGRVAFHDAGEQNVLDVDCDRAELICPTELWPAELVLDNETGHVNVDGDVLLVPFAGQGSGACKLQPGSLGTADIDTRGVPAARTWQATVLSDGQLRTVLDAACFGAGTGLPPDAKVQLTVGFTAARR